MLEIAERFIIAAELRVAIGFEEDPGYRIVFELADTPCRRGQRLKAASLDPFDLFR